MAKRVKNDLPFNVDAEKAVLGSSMLTKDAAYNVLSSLEIDDFYDYKHQKIYEALSTLLQTGKEIDILTVSEELDNMKELENVGGVDYLKELTQSSIALGNLKAYIDIVYDESVLRKMLTCVRKIDQDYREEEIESPNDFILKSEAAFKESIEKRHVDNFVKMEEAVGKVQNDLNILKERAYDSDLIGLDTGYPGINAITQGFKKGEVIIIAARPNVGKTMLALNFAYKVAITERKAVAMFSLEMDSATLTKRLLGIASGVELKAINTGRFTGQDKVKVNQAMKELSELPIYIDETPGIKLLDIIAKTRKLAASEPRLGMVVVDYLGLIQLGGKSKAPDSRQEEVRKISLELKALARETGLPIIVISQLSRDVEKRDTKKPMLSDLRDSGSIEQDADVVMLLYREDYYAEQKKISAGDKKPGQLTSAEKFEIAKARKEKELGDAMPGNSSLVEVNIAKNRNGNTGKTPLFFFKSYGRFDTPSKAWLEEMEKIGKDE